MLFPLLAIGLVGGLLLSSGSRGARTGGGAGWGVKNDGVVLTPALRAFMDRLRAAVPDSIPLLVTSGVRTPAAQAHALLGRLERGVNLFDLYAQDDLVQELVQAGPPDLATLTATLEAQTRRGRFLSRHMRGDALDLRTHNLTPEQVAIVAAKARALGAEALNEGDHLHLEEVT